ncbi:TPA: hypothetical protein ACGUMG_004478, partial [Vibrio vulnificus]
SPHTKNATRHESLLNALLCAQLQSSFLYFDSWYNQANQNTNGKTIAVKTKLIDCSEIKPSIEAFS